MEIPQRFHIFETIGWLVSHRINSALPGYLMVSSKADTDDLSELSEGALCELGPLLAVAQRALKQELHAQRVYIGRYGHSPGYPIHFHVIPIYDWVEALFWKDERYRLLGNFAEGPGETVTDGAELTLFVWREFCERAAPPTIEGPTVSEVVGLLREVVCLSSPALPDQEMMRCNRKRR
ncbi:HIT family protein [Rhizobium sp. VS19-DR104.2]|uniref:HIT family protein n=1 Tax=unclassified Rhizobium TaxID=2613769 RepID=UPI001C5B7596|nr:MULTISPECIES: HIT family protein [unclassified Rhizobium]MBZ5762091.1 HIT family protein [Rhizobium sp. VS19-DR96]MBZ5768204.1 HIT family protein [Rhizobium sp. VS19-DR129.2]MBZ5775731.1 HIT family protein [Rhizobium sp. VS19-DRK62.2]MBZ5786968.1 HIT family protein [Rhizobium sp. VS19-DR121]MBZ5804129.1 HIT family protein [Rhizobium sp. VS19-DR181]